MFTVSTAAAETNLTTLDAVKLALAKTDTTDDPWLTTQIEVQTQVVCNYLGVEMADDGSRTLGRETIVETFDRRGAWPWTTALTSIIPSRDTDSLLALARKPIVSITSVTEDNDAVTSTDYQLAGAAGTLKRLSSSLPVAWPSSLIVVTYVAGWLLPDETDRTLPIDIEDATISLVKAAWFAKRRDPSVKSEDVSGIRRVDYFFGLPGQEAGMPPDVAARLNRYRNISL